MERYDAIIIGAGVGGLLTGNFLARKGLRTVILEQHSQPGGYVCGFRRQGFYFDGGDQSFGSSGIVFPVLKQLGLDRAVRFVRADYRWKTPWADFRVDSLANVQEAVTAAFPESRFEIEAYFRDLRLCVRAVQAFGRHPNPLLNRGLSRYLAFARFMAEGARAMSAVRAFTGLSGLALAERHFTNPVLIDFFGRFGYTGAAAISTAGAWGSWLYDYWYPLGGLQSFADLLAQSFADHGGELRYRTRVGEILLDPGPRAAGVRTETGERLTSRYVVAASDHRRLAQEMLPAVALDPAWLEESGTAPVSDPL
ncbi:MAG: phytoene desaturase family protein, partial [Methanocella sp.]